MSDWIELLRNDKAYPSKGKTRSQLVDEISEEILSRAAARSASSPS